VAIAPAGFGSFGGDLLVGNFGDGMIHAFDPNGGGQLGTLAVNANGDPVVIDGLWALKFGTGAGSGGASNLLYFTAGPNDEANGLFGSLEVAPEPGSAVLLLAGGLSLFAYRSRRGRKD
jgi:uncharacterized protein (TIGR03118 family)